jgi:hypothetical protein
MKDDTALLRQALEALEEIHPGNMTPMAEQNWNVAIAALRHRLGLCPECGAETRQNHDFVGNVETFWKTCTECDWIGEPE